MRAQDGDDHHELRCGNVVSVWFFKLLRVKELPKRVIVAGATSELMDPEPKPRPTVSFQMQVEGHWEESLKRGS